MKKIVLNYAPHTYLTRNGKGGFLLSIIIPIPVGKNIVFDPITYMTRKVKITANVVDDASNSKEYVWHYFEIKGALLTSLNKKVEVILTYPDGTYKSCDKYIDADDVAFDTEQGVAKNCPHSFLGKEQGNTFFPKAIVLLSGYEFRGEIDIIRTSEENGICECTMKLHEDDAINDEILVLNDLNSIFYKDQGVIADSNFIIFTYLIEQASAQSSTGMVAMSAAGGPIKRRKGKKRNGDL
ncbi:MAG: hypothetical protein AAF849_10990 [Bacteroidota bacterium]